MLSSVQIIVLKPTYVQKLANNIRHPTDLPSASTLVINNGCSLILIIQTVLKISDSPFKQFREAALSDFLLRLVQVFPILYQS